MATTRINVWLSPPTLDHLSYYVKKTYGKHKATSIAVEHAIREFLCSRFKCAKCGKGFSPYNNADTWILHHVVPKDEGGTDEPENRMVLCRACHVLTHNITSMRPAKWSIPKQPIK